MCDFQGKLVAWLDGELLSDEAGNTERHIKECRECRNRVAAYEKVSETFDVYCDAVMGGKAQHRVPRWVPVVAGAIAATIAAYFAIPRTRIEPPPVLTPTIATVSVPAPIPALALPGAEPAPRRTIHKRHAAPPMQVQTAKWQPTESAVQIAIPAEAMFPPGVMPKGMNFIAELSIAPDGSVRQVRLRQ